MPKKEGCLDLLSCSKIFCSPEDHQRVIKVLSSFVTASSSACFSLGFLLQHNNMLQVIQTLPTQDLTKHVCCMFQLTPTVLFCIVMMWSKPSLRIQWENWIIWPSIQSSWKFELPTNSKFFALTLIALISIRIRVWSRI